MSGTGDEIVFEDVSYREPRRSRRPDRDPSRACLAYGLPAPGELAIFLDLKPADAIERHALSDTSVELGGILLGMECLDEETGQPFVWVTESLQARHYENTQASFTYTHESWAEITRERDQRFPDLDIVGWYHTHPDFGIFLSSHDLFIHHNFFAQPLQLAYVVDPIRQTRGFFQWREDQVEAVGGFQITGPRAERPALARFVHDLENFPALGPGDLAGGLGGLSPRLEAELIAMLNRPHAPAAVGASSGQTTAAVFGLLGMLLGVIGVVTALWLNHMSNALADQGKALKALEETVAARVAAASDVRVSAKEEALDGLLRQVRLDGGPEQFKELYGQAVARTRVVERERDELLLDKRSRAAHLASLEADVAERDETIAGLKSDVATEKKAAEGLKQEIAEKEAEIDQQKSFEAGALAKKYGIAWYAAVIAGAACVLLGLSLIWALARITTAPPRGDAPNAA